MFVSRVPTSRLRRRYKLAQQYGLSDEQLCFRRAKLDELGSADLFRQEYPSTPLESFLTSGRCFVEDSCLRAAEQECYTLTSVAITAMGRYRLTLAVPIRSGALRCRRSLM